LDLAGLARWFQLFTLLVEIQPISPNCSERYFGFAQHDKLGIASRCSDLAGAAAVFNFQPLPQGQGSLRPIFFKYCFRVPGTLILFV
jgi:hypothetical protein